MAKLLEKLSRTGHRSQLETLEAASEPPSDDPGRFVEEALSPVFIFSYKDADYDNFSLADHLPKYFHEQYKVRQSAKPDHFVDFKTVPSELCRVHLSQYVFLLPSELQASRLIRIFKIWKRWVDFAESTSGKAGGASPMPLWANQRAKKI
jgi:hypothetical protein